MYGILFFYSSTNIQTDGLLLWRTIAIAHWRATTSSSDGFLVFRLQASALRTNPRQTNVQTDSFFFKSFLVNIFYEETQLIRVNWHEQSWTLTVTLWRSTEVISIMFRNDTFSHTQSKKEKSFWKTRNIKKYKKGYIRDDVIRHTY